VVVDVGDRRGDRIAVAKGLKPGDIVVTTGQIKLQNGSRLKVVDGAGLTAPAKPALY